MGRPEGREALVSQHGRETDPEPEVPPAILAQAVAESVLRGVSLGLPGYPPAGSDTGSLSRGSPGGAEGSGRNKERTGVWEGGRRGREGKERWGGGRALLGQHWATSPSHPFRLPCCCSPVCVCARARARLRVCGLTVAACLPPSPCFSRLLCACELTRCGESC